MRLSAARQAGMLAVVLDGGGVARLETTSDKRSTACATLGFSTQPNPSRAASGNAGQARRVRGRARVPSEGAPGAAHSTCRIAEARCAVDGAFCAQRDARRSSSAGPSRPVASGAPAGGLGTRPRGPPARPAARSKSAQHACKRDKRARREARRARLPVERLSFDSRVGLCFVSKQRSRAPQGRASRLPEQAPV